MTFLDQRGGEIVRRLPPGDVIGAEVGVWDGRLSRWLLSNRDNLTLLMVDRWQAVPDGHRYRRGSGSMGLKSQETFDRLYRQCQEIGDDFPKRARLIRAESVDAARAVPDQILDFVFIDADHTYEGVRDDLLAWSPKLKPHGLLGGHDWDHPDHLDEWGVRRAVEEYAKPINAEIELGHNRTWFLKWQQYRR